MITASTVQERPKARRVLGQGVLLTAGFAFGQGLSLIRNAILGYALAKGDFGLAALLTLSLQMIETLSELGADRLIVQAPDGDDPRLLASVHTVLLGRGLLTAALLYALAVPISAFFGVPEQAGLFAALAIVPLVRGLLNLDQRVQQRRLDNRAYLGSDIAGQCASLVVTLVGVSGGLGPEIVVWAALAQAGGSVLVSHALARQRWSLGLDLVYLRRLLAFGWPIWLSAFPLVAVYQADRVLVARALGLEPLAAFSAAFMMTLVPSLVVAKVAQALVLPLFSECREAPDRLATRYRLLLSVAGAVALGYVTVMAIGGGVLLRLAFGPSFAGHGTLVAGLAIMWSLRMIQAIPGMMLVASARTGPLLAAGLARAAAFPFAGVLVLSGAGIAGVVLAGVLGEIASLLVVAWMSRRLVAGALRLALLWVALLVHGALLWHLAAMGLTDGLGVLGHLAFASAAGGLMLGSGLFVQAETRREVAKLVGGFGRQAVEVPQGSHDGR